MKKFVILLLLLAPSVLAQNPTSGGPIPQTTYQTLPNNLGVPNGTTVSGSDITFPGGLSLPTIVSTSGQAGADLGARINSCFAVAKIVAVGGVCDARQDTGTTISTQINFPQSGTPPVTVLLPPAHISQSAKINIANCAGCAIIGSGSADTAATSMTSLTWTGITTDPQIYITGNRNRIEHLNLKGSTVHLPLAGIEIDSTGTNDGLFNMLTDLQIGDFALGIGQYTNGVLIAGPNSAASNNTLNSVYIVGAVNCFSNTNQQATDTMLRDFTALYCTVGLHANTGIVVQNAYFGGNTGADVELDGAGEVNIHNYNSQNSARIAQQSATATNVKLEIIGGNAGFGSLLNADGKVINFCNVGGTLSSYIDIQDFTWNQAGQTQEAVICQFNSSGGSNSYDFLRLVNTTGFPPTAINIGTNQGPNDQRTVIYEPAIDSGTPHQVPRMALHTSYIKVADRAWQSWRNDFAGKFNIFGGEFRVNQLEPPGTTFGVAVATIGVTGATQYCYRVTALTYSGETTALAEQCVANGNAVLSASNREEIFWAQVLGAYAYNVYGRTTGAEQLMFTVTHDQLTQFTPPAYVVSYSAGNVRVKDTGATTPSGALPTTNTTGAATIEGQITSTVATGTAPFSVTSTTPVANLQLSSLSRVSTTVTIGSGADIAATSLCSTALCGAGTYRVNVYIDMTTPCGTTGTFIAWLGYTDDSGARAGSSTTTFFDIQGIGAVPTTGTLTTTSTANWGQATYILRTTGAATGGLGSINYGATRTACGTAGPMVGKMYLTVEQIQ